ncbi:MAG: hypothetical protein LBR32_02210 [Propionibacteriaceae bacterium]|nr:hypothetical protein [Propionibacteriaceae bacterium]
MSEIPSTGDAEIDAVLAGLDLSGDVHGHPEQLAAALEALQGALNRPAEPA